MNIEWEIVKYEDHFAGRHPFGEQGREGIGNKSGTERALVVRILLNDDRGGGVADKSVAVVGESDLQAI